MPGKKRSVKDEPIILDENFLPHLLQTVKKVQWPYKVNSAQLQQRDQALTAFLILTGIRNGESQTIYKKQTRNYKTHILIVNIKPSKNGNLRQKIILPKTGDLSPFTTIFEEWLKQAPDENSILFPTANAHSGTLNWNKPLGTKRVHWIIKTTNGMFPQWYRGVCETIYGKKIFKNDVFALQGFMGIKNMQNLSPYVESQWEHYTKNILHAKIK
jgi:hypothetical protein